MNAVPSGDIRVGVSGWLYKPWRGTFYPKKLAHKNELAYIGSQFRTVEINSTFYRTQAPQSFARWNEAVPGDFTFAVKCPRFITHMRRLREIETPLANFFASGVLRLGSKLGPLLWQFPPNFQFDAQVFAEFLGLLPRTTTAAARLARRHDHRVRKGVWTKAREHRTLRYAVEIRHESFAVPEFVKMLRAHNVALVCADTVSWPQLMDVTADFVYCRLHGSEELYRSNYSSRDLDLWAARVAAWAQGGDAPDGRRILTTPARKRTKRDVYVYFDNTDKVRAPGNALGLIARTTALSASKG